MKRHELRDPPLAPNTRFDRFMTVAIAIVLLALSLGLWVESATAEEPEPLPELEGAVAVVFSNCGIVTDIKVIDRGGLGVIEGAGLQLRGVYEGAKATVEFAKQFDQAWAVRSGSDCESLPF